MIRIAIVDDNKQYIEKVKNLLGEYFLSEPYEVYEYLSGSDFLHNDEYLECDIVFLDIILGNENGIELGKIINEKAPYVNIIFMSVNSEYFKDVYHVKHSYFLTKEFEKSRFFEALDNACENVRKKYIFAYIYKNLSRICLNDVMYFEGILRHTRVYYSSGQVKELTEPLKDIEARFSSEEFIKVHKSFLINIDYIESYDKRKIKFPKGYEVPISRNYSSGAVSKILHYLGDNL